MSKTLSSKSEKSVMKATQPRSRKGSMRRRGGPDNASCKFKGTFKDPEAAVMAYDEAAIKLFVATSKDTLVDRKEIGIPEERIIEEQHRKCPPAEAHDKPAGSLFGAYAVLNFSKSVPQVKYPPGHEFSPTTNPYDYLINNQLINDDYNSVLKGKQCHVGPIVNHDEVQGDNAGKNGENLEERCNNIKENLMMELPEFDNSSLWDEVMGTTDLETIENPGDLNADVCDEIFKDILEDDLGLDNFWL
ncbi:hypothetical protein AgCh_009804 [Apium graveolens]